MPKSLLDYYGESSETEALPSSFQGMKAYWMTSYRVKEGGEYQWSAKDQTLLSKMMKEYSTEDLVAMITIFFRDQSVTSKLGVFYTMRGGIYRTLHPPENYGWN